MGEFANVVRRQPTGASWRRPSLISCHGNSAGDHRVRPPGKHIASDVWMESVLVILHLVNGRSVLSRGLFCLDYIRHGVVVKGWTFSS